MLETLRQLGHGLAVPILTASLGPGAAAAVPLEGPAFAAGFRAAMLAMGSIVFAGVLLAAARRPAAPALASPRSARAVDLAEGL